MRVRVHPISDNGKAIIKKFGDVGTLTVLDSNILTIKFDGKNELVGHEFEGWVVHPKDANLMIINEGFKE